MDRIAEATLLTAAEDKVALDVDAVRGCGCPLCLGKTIQSDIAFGVSDTIPSVPSSVTVPVGGTLDGYISPVNDTDLIGISVVAGATYLIGMDGSGDDPLEDSFIVLYNSLGNLVAFDDDGGTGTNSLLTFTAATTGTYYVSAEAFAGTGQYTITVKERGVDDVPDTFAGAVAISADASVFNFLETSLDVDTYRIDLVAGQFVNFEVAGGADYLTNFLAVPPGELDTILALYDAAGNRLALNDDISFPSDISSALSFFVETSGTYYLDVLAYPGQTGGYHLVTTSVDLATADPLDAIDWRNATPVRSNVTVYFAPAGVVLDGVTSLGWNSYEIEQAMIAFQTYEDIIDITVTITTDPTDATFRLVTTEDVPFLGYMYPNDPAFGADVGIGVFARDGFGWNEEGGAGLEQGGYGFVTLIHEFGHGFGLAHPHDTGGGSDVLPGVTSPFGSYGVYDLNQGVYTQMSYNSGWQLHPDIGPGGYPPSVPVDYGYEGTPMALDVALLQRKYGANTSFAAGNDTYVLSDINESGSFYRSIWDTGGTDAIVYNGNKDATIDLLAATIDYSATGGGVISYVDDVYGGYTIAEGVVIENAVGGRGNDAIFGNSAANTLEGKVGNDTIEGRGGNDVILTGVGSDVARGGDGNDRIDGDSGADELYGDAGADNIDGGSDADRLFGGADADTVHGGSGNDMIRGDAGDDQLYGDSGDDRIAGGAGNDLLSGGSGRDIFFFDDLFGNDRILDFNPRSDLLDFSRVGAVRSGAVGVAGGVLIAFGDGSSIELAGVSLGQLSGSGWFTNTPVPGSDVLFA